MSIQLKKCGQLRLCLDPRRLNEALVREAFHTAALDEALPELSQERVFSKFDLADGFWLEELDELSSKLTTFQTPFGRYRFRRLPFGPSVGPEIFYKRLFVTLVGLPGLVALADDVLVFGRGPTGEEAQKDHDGNLKAFLYRCLETGIKLSKDKAKLRVGSTKLFGILISD